MIIKNIKISDLEYASYNPRKLSKNQESEITKSLEKFGFVDPIVVNKNNFRIIGGHQRALCWGNLGNKEIPVFFVDLNEKDERELNIRLNSNTGSWDLNLLKDQFNITDLEEWGMDLTIDEFKDLKIEEVDPDHGGVDEISEPQKNPVTIFGDLYELGDHRLLCGDSTILNDVEILMNGKKADNANNDPPYGMKKEGLGIINDNLNYDDLLQFNKDWINLQFLFLKDTGSFYCWGIDEPLMDIYSEILKPLIRTQKATFRNLITWDKNSGQGQNSEIGRSFARVDEKCLFVMCGVQGFNNNSDNYFEGWDPIRKYLECEMKKCGGSKNWKKALGNQMGKHYFIKSQWNFPTYENYKKLQEFAKKEAFKKEYEVLKKEYEKTIAYFDNVHDKMNNVWHFKPTNNEERNEADGHVTPKPIELCERIIKSSCPKNGITLDFFIGSGSTLIACEKTNRKCYGIEISPQYIDVTIKRWCKYSGVNKFKRNGKTISINDFK